MPIDAWRTYGIERPAACRILLGGSGVAITPPLGSG
jgi:hypothetical protein